MINRKLTGLGAALIMGLSAGVAYADEGDMTQTRTQDRIREEVNLQTPDSEQAQSRYRDQQTSQQQIRNEFRYSGAGVDQARQSGAATGTRQTMSRH